MEETEGKARELGARSLLLHAQVQAAGFYEAAGYTSQGKAFTEDGWPHVSTVSYTHLSPFRWRGCPACTP